MCFRTVCVFTLLAAIGGKAALASPLHFKLLPLIPPGSQLISGFEITHDRRPSEDRSLLLTTRNNVLDLEDWVALAGVDPGRSVKQVLQASLAKPGTALPDHLLLITGEFRGDRIFRAAELNGAKRFQHLAETLLAVEPFPRERVDMVDVRWLAILDNRIAVFGTPWMVTQALSRWENRVQADPVLMDRVALLPRDVTCWNIMTALPEPHSSGFLDSNSQLSALFQGSELMMLGVHADTNVRVDLLLRADATTERNQLQEKVTQFSQLFNPNILHRDEPARHLKRFQVNGSQVQVSIQVSRQAFVAWKNRQMGHEKELLDAARKIARRAESSRAKP